MLFCMIMAAYTYSIGLHAFNLCNGEGAKLNRSFADSVTFYEVSNEE